MPGFRQAAGGHIAHRDGAAVGHQLAHEFAAHPRAGACHHGDPAGEVFHWFPSFAVVSPAIRSGRSIHTVYRSTRRSTRPTIAPDGCKSPDSMRIACVLVGFPALPDPLLPRAVTTP